MTTNTERLSVGEKIGYSLGDLAANLIFQTFITFLAFFYTDIYKIPAGTASAIIFWGGVFGGVIFNPIMGLIADRTNTRWGKFRPWVLWTAVPFGVFALLAFTTPDLGEQGKIWYAAITYTLLVTIYAANNLPYAALSGVLTGNMSERNSLSSYRFVAVMVAQFVIQVLLLPLVLALGDGDQAVVTILDTPENRRAMPDADPARWVAPADLARIMVFLASPAARAIHGAAIPVTGLS